MKQRAADPLLDTMQASVGRRAPCTAVLRQTKSVRNGIPVAYPVSERLRVVLWGQASAGRTKGTRKRNKNGAELDCGGGNAVPQRSCIHCIHHCGWSQCHGGPSFPPEQRGWLGCFGQWLQRTGSDNAVAKHKLSPCSKKETVCSIREPTLGRLHHRDYLSLNPVQTLYHGILLGAMAELVKKQTRRIPTYAPSQGAGISCRANVHHYG